MRSQNDRAIRAMTEDGAFRAIAVRATETVRGAIHAQKAAGRTMRLFGDLLVGAILVRETMAPTLRVQMSLRGRSGQGLLADSHPDGRTRGLTSALPAGAEIDFGGEAQLQVSRHLPRTGLHQSVVHVSGWEDVADGIVTYMHDSEQVDSMIAIASVIEGDEVVAAGGYVVQTLPEADHEAVLVMSKRLKDRFRIIDAEVQASHADPDRLLAHLLEGMPYRILEVSSLSFGCQCSFERALDSLAVLARGELEECVASDQVIEMSCDYCGTQYKIGSTAIQSLLDRR